MFLPLLVLSPTTFRTVNVGTAWMYGGLLVTTPTKAKLPDFLTQKIRRIIPADHISFVLIPDSKNLASLIKPVRSWPHLQR